MHERPDFAPWPDEDPAPSWEELKDRAERLVAAAREAGVTLGTAESCTGGLVGAAITAVPGSSEPYLGGVVSYACSVKESLLGVPAPVIESVGAVSEECVRAMAAGVRAAVGSDLGVSVSGIAGPGGAVPGKPVGTVWFACCAPGGTVCELHRFDGGREEVRFKSVACALGLLGRAIMDIQGRRTASPAGPAR